MATKIIGTRWQNDATGEVLRIEHTSQDRRLHEVYNETTGFNRQIVQADLERDWSPLDPAEDDGEPEGGDEGDEQADG